MSNLSDVAETEEDKGKVTAPKEGRDCQRHSWVRVEQVRNCHLIWMGRYRLLYRFCV